MDLVISLGPYVYIYLFIICLPALKSIKVGSWKKFSFSDRHYVKAKM